MWRGGGSVKSEMNTQKSCVLDPPVSRAPEAHVTMGSQLISQKEQAQAQWVAASSWEPMGMGSQLGMSAQLAMSTQGVDSRCDAVPNDLCLGIGATELCVCKTRAQRNPFPPVATVHRAGPPLCVGRGIVAFGGFGGWKRLTLGVAKGTASLVQFVGRQTPTTNQGGFPCSSYPFPPSSAMPFPL